MLKKLDIGTSEIEQVEAFNALVDAVNELQHDNSEKANCQENVQDKFAEQRKWIGKACWFWDEDRKDARCDVLYYVDEYSEYPYVNVKYPFFDFGRYCGYKHCEPVKPDDDIIYKGGNNE